MQRLLALALSVTLVLPACVSAQGLDPGTWKVLEIDGQPFAAAATLEIGADGRIGGSAPCNRWFSRATGEDGVLFGMIGSTKRACDDLPFESLFFQSLEHVTAAAVDGDRLTLSGPDHSLVLERAQQ